MKNEGLHKTLPALLVCRELAFILIHKMEWTFRWVMYAVVMPVISLLDLIGNVTSICVLHHRDIQLKK